MSRLGVGTALFGELTDDEAARIVRTAVERSVRHFDTAPLYGYGVAERRLGAALATVDRASVVVSTKVGRIVGADGASVSWDFGRSGVLSSLEASLARLGVDHVDIALIHDPDDHAETALKETCAALTELRGQGVVRAIGVGINQTALAARFVREADIDLVLLAGRYSLLDRSAVTELLPLCLEREVDVVVGGVYNSGILATGEASSTYDYREPDHEILARVDAIKRLCHAHRVPLRAAALQFPSRHPAVVSTVAGVRSEVELVDNCDMAEIPIPEELWDALDSY
ncbi:aldo/keto reductase [Nonomuraea sp. NPDC046802]|uniref:aldo/keto reductase n=1 Tax=Nonomuraea sp. NPDC046802 TaxID=3154919 RepID=UPI0033DECD4B